MSKKQSNPPPPKNKPAPPPSPPIFYNTFLERLDEQKWKDLNRFMEKTYEAIHLLHDSLRGDTGYLTEKGIEYRLDEMKEILDSRPF